MATDLKTDLVSTTATIGHNQPSAMTEDECKSLAVVAFKETDEANKQLGTAVQRMAAAVMAHHANRVANATKGNDIIKLSKVCHPDEAMGRATLQKAMVAFFIPGRIVSAVKTDADKTAKRDAESKHVKLVRDGLELASILSLCMVELSAYDKTTGLWNVPIALFCSDEFAVETDAKTLTMDGTAWVARKLVAGGKPEYESFMSSVARLKEMRKPKVARAPGSNANQDGKVTISAQIAVIMQDLRATDNGKAVYPTLSSLDDRDQKALAGIVKWYELAKAADIAKDAAPRKRAA